jgi:hypothetical protein
MEQWLTLLIVHPDFVDFDIVFAEKFNRCSKCLRGVFCTQAHEGLKVDVPTPTRDLKISGSSCARFWQGSRII